MHTLLQDQSTFLFLLCKSAACYSLYHGPIAVSTNTVFDRWVNSDHCSLCQSKEMPHTRGSVLRCAKIAMHQVYHLSTACTLVHEVESMKYISIRNKLAGVFSILLLRIFIRYRLRPLRLRSFYVRQRMYLSASAMSSTYLFNEHRSSSV